MTIQKNFVIRHRAEGHIRFQVPEVVATAAVAARLTEEISGIKGVYRVVIFRRDKKLSIRFDESVCALNSLASELVRILKAMESQGALVQTEGPKAESIINNVKHKIGGLRWPTWMRNKTTEAKETLQAVKIISKLGIKKPKALIKDPEKAVIDFLNDVLVLYLIKLHWTRITQEWLPKPITYRYEWLAVFYLFYLLIRSRRPK